MDGDMAEPFDAHNLYPRWEANSSEGDCTWEQKPKDQERESQERNGRSTKWSLKRGSSMAVRHRIRRSQDNGPRALTLLSLQVGRPISRIRFVSMQSARANNKHILFADP